MIMSYLAVACGGALGAMSRFWVYNMILKIDDESFPYATLTVNILGSFLIGLAFVLIVERAQLGPQGRGLITVGFLGAFTTFSTFSLDALGLMEQGQISTAMVYIFTSVVVCIGAAWLGITLARGLL